jgi:TonB-linked SusC/RagA family outer membrane protein
MIKIKINYINLTVAMLIAMVTGVSAQNQQVTLETDTVQVSNKKQLHTEKYSVLPAAYVTGEEISIPGTNINNMLFGRIPGLIVSENGGEPGNDVAGLSIRGKATYNNQGLVVFVDGFEVEMKYFQHMSPEEIQTIEVLKDAASLAPLGMRGGNGVLWVTTKRGVEGKTKIFAQVRGGFQEAVHIQQPINSQRYGQLYNEAYSNALGTGVWTPFYSQAEIDALPNANWYDEVLKDNAPLMDADFTMSGGNEKVKYYFNAGYMGQYGLYDVKTTDTTANANFERYNIRTNLDVEITPVISAKLDFGMRIESRKSPGRSGNALWNDLVNYPNIVYTVKDELSGEWSGTAVNPNNPVASVNAVGYDATQERMFQSNLQLKEDLRSILPGLYLDQSVSFSNWVSDGSGNTRNYARVIDGVNQTTDENTPYSRYENSGNNQWWWRQFKAGVGYDGSSGKHNYSFKTDFLYRFYTNDENTNGAAGPWIDYKSANLGGGFNYDYDKRYSATYTFSAASSDNYHPNHRTKFYSAVSVGWLASAEDFLKNSKWINKLRLNASMGEVGWDPMREMRYLYQEYFSGIRLRYIPDERISPETATKYDLGFQAQILDHLNLNVNYFIENRTGIVDQDNMIPATSGFDARMFDNIGEVTNKGYELQLNWSDNTGDLKYSIGTMLTYSKNTIDFRPEVVTIPSTSTIGKPILARIGLVSDGFYDISDFDSNGNLTEALPQPSFGDVAPGDLKYKDIYEDGIIDQNDYTQIGNSGYPTMNYAFTLNLSYKNLDLFAQLDGVDGRELNLLGYNQTDAFVNGANAFGIAEGRWAYYPDQGIDTRSTATYPRLSTMNSANNTTQSDFWVVDGDYMRLRNVTLGYNVPVKGLVISKLRFELVGTNLLTISKTLDNYNFDPSNPSGYPVTKTYSLGCSLTF